MQRAQRENNVDNVWYFSKQQREIQFFFSSFMENRGHGCEDVNVFVGVSDRIKCQFFFFLARKRRRLMSLLMRILQNH